MVNATYLTSAVLTALLAAGVVALVLRGRRWERYTPRVADRELGGGSPATGLARVAGGTNTWTAAYIVLVVGFLLGAMVYSSGAVSGGAMIAAVVAIVSLYLVAGVYVAMVENGRPSAQAAAGSALATGLLLVLAITVVLVTAG
jgi:hypothetical protein